MSETARAPKARQGIYPELQLMRCGQFLLDAQTRRLVAPGNRSIPCTKLEYKILFALMGERGRPLSLERLILRTTTVDNEPTAETLRVTISKLRKKIKTAEMDDPIIAEQEVGYRIDTGLSEIEVLVMDRPRLNALQAVLTHCRNALPDEVRLLRTAG